MTTTLNFTTIDDLAREIAERLDHGDTDQVAEAIRSHRDLFRRYEDIQAEADLEPILGAVRDELLDARTKQHVEAVLATYHRLGRQAAAEVLVEYEAVDLEQIKQAMKHLREHSPTPVAEPIIETARWLKNVYGELIGEGV